MNLKKENEFISKPYSKSIVLLTTLFLFIFITDFQSSLFSEQEKKPAEKTEKKIKKENQKKKEKKKKEETKKLFYKMTVTATGTKKDTFDIPKSVSVVTDKEIKEKTPNNVSDLLLNMPGVDVNGVGSNQSRPVIRGMRGQRILLLEDGIRMNNSRRQQDFGEIPAIVDVANVERVEVVRGPASVLYGSDAIGGVVNIITRLPEYDISKSSFNGTVGHRYSTHDSQNKVHTSLYGNIKRFGFVIGGNYKQSENYLAPAGTFGNIELGDDTFVYGTGLEDGGMNVMFRYKLKDSINLSLRYEYYKATDAGFGYVDPADYNPGDALIKITYPNQEVEKYTFKYENNDMDFFMADRMSFVVYTKGNERELANDIFVPLGIPGMPNAGINILTENYSDITTSGFRMEMNKTIKNHLFTYGTDYFVDSTKNTDKFTFQMLGFGPPSPSVDRTPNVPNASYKSLGIFVQDDISLTSRASLILGVRYQSVNAKTKDTPGLEGEPVYNSTDDTFVGAANLSYGITENLKLVVSVGRGFRSPNLIERFYNGAIPEGSAFQSRSTGLKAETSLNFDLGFKFRSRIHFLEFTYFNNKIYDGIRISPTGETIFGLPEYRNLNVDELKMEGYEVAAGVYLDFGLSLTFNYTNLNSDNLGDPETPYVDTYSSKFNFSLRYENPGGLFWASYDLRINGEQKEVQLGDNPIGETIPGFTVHNASAGINLFQKNGTPMRIGILVGNLTNTLYSEFSNASFFRPAPKRYVVLTWSMDF